MKNVFFITMDAADIIDYLADKATGEEMFHLVVIDSNPT